jgi:hypothetical protein
VCVREREHRGVGGTQREARHNLAARQCGSATVSFIFYFLINFDNCNTCQCGSATVSFVCVKQHPTLNPKLPPNLTLH